MFEIKENIKKACENHEFVGIVCEDGHEHTVKAFGNVCGTPFDDLDEDDGELSGQLYYCEQIAKGFDVEILTADTKEEAVENDILEEGTYYVK